MSAVTDDHNINARRAVWQGVPGGYGAHGGAPHGMMPIMPSMPGLPMMLPGGTMPPTPPGQDSAPPPPNGSGTSASPAGFAGNGGETAMPLSTVFDSDDEASMMRIPSPPPLPDDWDAVAQPSSLFDFSQFQHRMPGSQPMMQGANKLVKDSTQEACDLADANVVYETQDDGDLMKLLFGVADEMPTMATIHLHKFPSASQPQMQIPDEGSPSTAKQVVRHSWHGGDSMSCKRAPYDPVFDSLKEEMQLLDSAEPGPMHPNDAAHHDFSNSHHDTTGPFPGKDIADPSINQLLNGDSLSLLGATDSPGFGGLLETS
eukprot:350318-Chlamydomonas_euryale.AAC.26